MVAVEVLGWREEDQAECLAVDGNGCAENCYQAMDMAESETYTIMNDGYPIGMFGVTPLVGMGIPPGWGTAWLLASNGLYSIKKEFLQQCPLWLDHLQRHYPVVTNFVHVKNTPGLRWCQYVGFSFATTAVPYGIAGEKFIQVTRSI